MFPIASVQELHTPQIIILSYSYVQVKDFSLRFENMWLWFLFIIQRKISTRGTRKFPYDIKFILLPLQICYNLLILIQFRYWSTGREDQVRQRNLGEWDHTQFSGFSLKYPFWNRISVSEHYYNLPHTLLNLYPRFYSTFQNNSKRICTEFHHVDYNSHLTMKVLIEMKLDSTVGTGGNVKFKEDILVHLIDLADIHGCISSY